MEIEDLAELCRVCLKSNLGQVLIYDEKRSFDGRLISEHLDEFIKHRDLITHEFPPFICTDCICNLKQAIEFKRQCERSFRTILDVLRTRGNSLLKDTNDKCVQREDGQTDDLEEKWNGSSPSKIETEKEISSMFSEEAVFIKHEEDSNQATQNFGNKEEPEIEIIYETTLQSDALEVGSLKEESDGSDYDVSGGVEGEDDDSDEEEDQPLSNLAQKGTKNVQLHHKEMKPINVEMQMVRGKKQFKCPDLGCGKLFTRACNVTRHFAGCHVSYKSYVCKVCQKAFSRPDYLRNHMISHKDQKPFSCTSEGCTRSFRTKYAMGVHQDKVHNGVPTEKTHVCEKCNKGFSSHKYLQVHMRKHTEKGFLCKICGEAFETKDDKLEHMKKHANDRPFLCSDCGVSFSRNDYLVIHMRRHRGEKPYKCKFCDKGFPRAADLNVHERYHTNVKSHLCTECGKGFHRSYNLTIHMRTHTGERPYSCPHCPKTFTQRNDMKTHVRRHTGERFKCEVCGDSFVQLYHLTNHKRTIHGMDVKSVTGRLKRPPTANTIEEHSGEMDELINTIGSIEYEPKMQDT